MAEDIAVLHRRYSLQTAWTKLFREYLYLKMPDRSPVSILEVGCGTGAVLNCINDEFQGPIKLLAGIDMDKSAVRLVKRSDRIICGTALAEDLPFDDCSFDFVYCHYMLLWTRDPQKVLSEMYRVTVPGGLCAAIAEPCYDELEAAPAALMNLAIQQRKKLAEEGALTGIGGQLCELFNSFSFKDLECGKYRRNEMNEKYMKGEIEQMLADLKIQPFQFCIDGTCSYYVPTYFAAGIKR